MLAITRERLAKGWTKAGLAHRARIDQSRVGRIEAGRDRPYAVELRRIARALGWKSDPTTLLDLVDAGSTTAPKLAPT